MTKEVQIGGEKVIFGASGALPITYRELTGREFFKDVNNVDENETAMVEMAWVMYRDANPDSTIGEKEWLKQFDFFDLNNALLEILDLLVYSQQTTSKAKKEAAR